MSLYHYTYLISSLRQGTFAKYYIGSRTTKFLPDNDPYMGSSNYLNNDIAKFGTESFEKIIIAVFQTEVEARNAETRLLNEHNANLSPLFYNQPPFVRVRKQKKVKPPKIKIDFEIISEKPKLKTVPEEPKLKIRSKTIGGRPVCEVEGCNRAAAINYKKDGRTYYRKKCTHCLREEKKPKKADWEIAGYVKKSKCEKCGFKAKFDDQIHVVKVKGTLHNYKSVCLNCEVELSVTGGWKQGDLTPDL